MKSGWGNGLRGIVALALLTGAAPTHAQIPQDGSTGGVGKEEPKIVAVRIVKENGEVLSNAPAGITVQTGKPLDRAKIAESLRSLYRTGDYADLRAVVTPEADGARLDFVVRENLFFNQVRIEGLSAPRAKPRQRRRCKSRWGRPTGARSLMKRWSGCERRSVMKACI